MQVYLNGAFVTQTPPLIHAEDRGFLLGDGLFETLKLVNHRPVFLSQHLERMSSGAALLGIPFTLKDDHIEAIIAHLIAVNQSSADTLCARLTLTRGCGPRGLLPPTEISPTVLLTVQPYNPAPDRPLKLCLASFPRNEFSPLSRIKSLGYTENVLARLEAQQQGADDALLLNTQGRVVCTSMANVFIVKNGRWFTPPISDGALPGILRAQVLSERFVEECSLTFEACQTADKVLISNALIGLKEACILALPN
jgi:branched-chain amino acid aminotransferase